eukprot:5696999-Amphidinium_carterae.3
MEVAQQGEHPTAEDLRVACLGEHQSAYSQRLADSLALLGRRGSKDLRSSFILPGEAGVLSPVMQSAASVEKVAAASAGQGCMSECNSSMLSERRQTWSP